ncbi:Jerky protein [Plakobranchus ocellatus]|uniref:Jerky protein n=1 Tax=Plakobranchus ocellatus TaxID=259542 RepID=A0AAV4D9Q1_9GAST|nr:Jerky protein [Plakobranchus ocellatus]
MVRNYICKREKYNKEDTENAIKAVRVVAWAIKKLLVSLKYKKKAARRNTALSANQEQELEECLLVISRWGFGLTRDETIHVVADFAASLNVNPFKAQPSKDWLRGFLKRRPRLTTEQGSLNS